MQGNSHGVRSTDNITFIHKSKILHDREVKYTMFVLNYRPLKDESHQVRITVGEDWISYPDNVGSPAANMMETIIFLNNTISDTKRGARFVCADIKDHFLATPMDREEYMHIKY